MNYLHEITSGTPEAINTIVEIPRGSKNKYEIDKDSGLIALDRPAHTAQDFPFDYGFVPQTWWDDGDPVDVIILASFPIHPGVLVHVRPVGIMNMIDDGDADDKVIGVPVTDPRFFNVQDIDDVNPHTLREMEHFYSTYKRLQDNVVEVAGFKDKAAAVAAFERGQELYKEKFGN
ncbi:MAG: inorganic diphosphatase [Candidatus Paceibacterota bacterium]